MSASFEQCRVDGFKQCRGTSRRYEMFVYLNSEVLCGACGIAPELVSQVLGENVGTRDIGQIRTTLSSGLCGRELTRTVVRWLLHGG